MLKSTLNAAKPSEPKPPTLPHLFRNNRHRYIALFYSTTRGVVVVPADDGLEKVGDEIRLGDEIRYGVGCFDTDTWTPLKPGESVTITVEED